MSKAENPKRSPEAVDPLLQRREAYLAKVRDFLQDAPFGSPRLLAVDDLARTFKAKTSNEFPPKITPLQTIQMQMKTAYIEERIRKRETTEQDYRKERKKLLGLSLDGKFDSEILNTESDIAREEFPYSGIPEKAGEEFSFQRELATTRACSLLSKLVNERLDEIEKDQSSSS